MRPELPLFFLRLVDAPAHPAASAPAVQCGVCSLLSDCSPSISAIDSNELEPLYSAPRHGTC
jgi:hypothetical protein